MALAEVQRALARLYTDEATRERFLADPAAAGEALGLSDVEAALLARLPADGLRYFAASLRRKRLGEVVKLLPLGHQALGPRFAALFWRYADTSIPTGTAKHRQDALAFAAFVERAAHGEALEPPWAADLLRYEAAWLACGEAAGRALVRRFRYPPARLAHAVATGAPPPPPRPTLAVWARLGPGSRWRLVTLPLPG